MLKKIVSVLLLLSVMALSGCKGTASSDGNIGEVKLETGDTYAVITVKDYGSITVKLYPELAPLAVQRFIENAESGYFEDKIFHRVLANFMIQAGSYDGTGLSDPNKKSYAVETNDKLRHFYGALCVGSSAFGDNGDQFYIVCNTTDTYKEHKANSNAMKQNIEAIDSQLPMLEYYLNSSELSAEDYQTYYYLYHSWKNQRRQFAAALQMFDYKSDEVAKKYASVGGAAQLDGGYTVMGQTIDGFDVIEAIKSVPVTLGSDNAQSLPITEVIIESVVVKKY